MCDPDACAGCELNPRLRPAPSARLTYLLRLRSWSAAGARFNIGDLPPQDWDDLAMIDGEIKAHEIESIKKT